MDQSSAILGQYPTLLHQIIHRGRVSRKIVFAVWMSLGDRLARITGSLPLGSGPGKWKIRRLKRNPLIGRANRRITKVPGGVGGQRYDDIRQAHPISLVAIG